MQSRSRNAFTLIELMVAMALTMFVMVILSQAFVLALETFSAMTGIGTMVSNLRTAETLLRDDLSQDHFEGIRRLSDLNNSPVPEIVAARPQAGFFALRQSTSKSAVAGSPYAFEGNDANGVPSSRAIDHYLHFTVKRKGNRQENFFMAALQNPQPSVLAAFFGQTTAYNRSAIGQLPYDTLTQPYDGSTTAFYSSQWAEVMYYLVRTGSTEEPNNPNSAIGTPTFGLYRAQFVMVPDSTNVNTVFVLPTYNAASMVTLSQTTFAGVSCNLGGAAAPRLVFFSPADAATQSFPQRVVPDLSAFNLGNVATAQRVFNAQTLVLPNVISFQVQTMPLGMPNFTDIFKYDTARLGDVGYYTNGLKAIQVTLRVWDHKTRQTRQATIIQDL